MDEETKTGASAQTASAINVETTEPAEAVIERKTRSARVARALIQKAKRATRRRFPAEDKIRIVLEGIRGEVSVVELCRREGIHATIYYKWLKDFLEAGKARMRGDATREATSDEVQTLRQENERLKQLVAELSLSNMTLKKSLY